ncbi:tetratricopeptide repeat protein, partial [Fusobacterium polymorphum]
MKQKEEEILKKIEKLSEDIQENSNNDSNFNQRGNYYYELKKYDEAITDYSEAIRIDSKNATYYNNRGKVYYNLKKYDEAIA